MKYNVLVDTGFWIALYNPEKDPKLTLLADKVAEDIIDETLIIPFPTLYEFVNSRLSRREAKSQFERVINLPNVIKFNDTDYCNKALENFFIKSNKSYSDISLVDEVLKLIMEDSTIKIDYIVSFDSGLINEAASKGIKNLL